MFPINTHYLAVTFSVERVTFFSVATKKESLSLTNNSYSLCFLLKN